MHLNHTKLKWCILSIIGNPIFDLFAYIYLFSSVGKTPDLTEGEAASNPEELPRRDLAQAQAHPQQQQQQQQVQAHQRPVHRVPGVAVGRDDE